MSYSPLPPLGQALGANSLPVVLASDSALSLNLSQLNGNTVSVGNGISGTGVLRVTLASDSTGQVTLAAGAAVIGHVIVDSGTITTVSTVTNLAQMNGVAITMGNGIAGTGVQRVAIASDNTAFSVNATLSSETTKVIGTINIASAQTLATVTTVSTVTNLAQMNGAALLMGNGTTGTGSQRVTIASDNTAFTVNPASATVPVSTMNSASANSGVNSAIAAVFDDTSPTAITENSFGFLRMSANRNLYVNIRDNAGNERGLNIDASGQLAVTLASAQTLGTVTTVTTVTTVSTVTNLAQMNGAALLMGNGTTGTGSQRVTIASDNTAFAVNPVSATVPVSTMNSASANSGLNSAMAAVFDDTSPTAITENSFGFVRMSANRNQYVTIRDAAGNERGLNIDASGQLAITIASAQTLATVTTVSTVTNLAQMNGVALLMGNGASGTGAQRVTISNDNTGIATWGQGATAATAPSGASYDGKRGTTALPTAVSDGQMVGGMADKYGRTVSLVGTIRDLRSTQTTTISASTSETTIVTAAASIFNDIELLVISNTSTATNTRIDFRDTTAGSILFSLQSNGGQPPIGFALGGAAIPQTTVNTNWTAQCATSTTDIRVYAVFAKNK